MDAKKIALKIFSQAEKGEIVFGDNSSFWSFYAKFSANIAGERKEGVDCPTIDIPDFDKFAKSVEEYLSVAKNFYKEDKEYFDLSEESFEEKLFFDLIINSTAFEQKNILSFVKKRKNMLSQPLSCGEKYIGEYEGKRVYANIKKNRSNLESPYKMSFSFKNEEGEFVLPAINFGFDGESVCLYAVQNKKEKQTSALAKKMDRYFRKLNSGVDMEDIVAEVSPNAVAALAMFASLCEKSGKKEIVAPDFLPIRYGASFSAKERLGEDKKEEAIEKLDRDQFNITNRFMYLFLRYNFHFPSAEATYDEDKGEMALALDGRERNGENIIFTLADFARKDILSPMDKKEDFER